MRMILFIVFLIHFSGNTQQLIDVNYAVPKNDFENIHVERLFGDSLSTSFLIWVKDTVPSHMHQYHTETIYVLEGEGKFYLNDSTTYLMPGNMLLIPKQNWHAVKVTSTYPMKVISIQSPGFNGSDRLFKSESPEKTH